MKRLTHNLSLHTKVSLLSLLTTVFTLLLLVGALTVLDLFRYRDALVSELTALLDTIGANTTAALRFDDTRTGEENLAALRANPKVIGAAIYGKSGTLFAAWPARRTPPAYDANQPPGAYFTSGRLLVVRDIRLEGDLLGRIFLSADSSEIRQRLLQYALLGLFILAFAGSIGYLISRQLLGMVIQPVLDLTAAARTVMDTATYDVRLQPVFADEVGELTECFGGMLSQIRQRDRELNLHREHLEELVRQRTAELEAAREKAEEAARMKSEFLANMSHEIRTPLNGMMGLTALALETPLPGEAREYLELASYSADTLLGVINDILDFSKIESGKLAIEQTRFHLHRMISRQLRLFALQAHRKHLELVGEIEPDVPTTVVGDPTRLQQILGNLLGNAVKFTATGDIVLRVSLVKEEAGEWLVRFSVADTGIGIPQEAQARIFDAFTQADGSTTRRFGGTGLGLAISRRLVERMGGNLTIESEVGRGSTFTFALPLGRTTDLEPLGNEGESLAGTRALIVDDHVVNRRILKAYAARLGMESVEARNSREALEAATAASAGQRPFHVIYCDRRMPQADGFHFIRELRRIPSLAATPVIMLSSMDGAEDAELCRALGIAHYLVKPVLLEDLRAVTWRVLHSAEPAPKPRAAPSRLAATATTQPLKILVAEDNSVNQRVIQRTLQKMGHLVTVVENGRLAVERAGEGFDLILMDCQMPEMDGFEASRQIRASASRVIARLPIIALTAFALDSDRDRCLAAGMSDYLRKPLDLHELAAKLAQYQPAGQPVRG